MRLQNRLVLALPMFHAYTGCDIVSSFANRGKKTAWDIWNVYDDVPTAFQALSESPGNMSVDIRAKLDRYTILLYDRTTVKRILTRPVILCL